MPTHTCPAAGCTRTVVHDQLMCRPHWKLVPQFLQRLVWREFRRAPGRAAHLKACNEAIAAVDRTLELQEARRRPQAELPL